MFSNNNDLWKEIARARRDDALRWDAQERQLKEAGPGKTNQSRAIPTLVAALVVACLTVARKFLAI